MWYTVPMQINQKTGLAEVGPKIRSFSMPRTLLLVGCCLFFCACAAASGSRAVFNTHDGERTIVPLATVVRPDGGVAVTIKKEAVPLNTRNVEVMCNDFFAQKGEAGWWLAGRGELGYFKTNDFSRVYGRTRVYMPYYGWKTSKGTHLAIVEGMRFEFEIWVTSDANGLYRAFPRWRLDDLNGPTGPYEDMTVVFYDLGPNADYNDMAKCYRRYKFAHDPAVKPFKERIKTRPHLAKLVRSLALRQQCAYKTTDWRKRPPVNYTKETEAPVKCDCSFARTLENLRQLKALGVEDIQICIAGWQTGGYDGRHPASFPVEDVCGGEVELRSLIKAAQDMGVIIDSQSNYTDCYTVSPWWHGGDVACMGPTGCLEANGAWLGGRSYNTCLVRAWNTYLPGELAKIRDLGFWGSAYVDVFTATWPYRCCNPRHPGTRQDVADIQLKVAKRLHELNGGFSSECCFDHLLGYTDYINYVSAPIRALRQRAADLRKQGKPFMPPVDRFVPFFELAFHDVVLSNPDKVTQELIRNPDDEVLLAEFGGRPIFYSLDGYVKRGQLPELKKAYDRYRSRSHLQIEEMMSHRELAPGVFQVVYANGESIVANHAATEFTFKGVLVPPTDWRLCK